MSEPLFDVAVPSLLHALESLRAVLAKGAEHAEQQKIDPAVLIGMRLFPDMLPLSAQVQLVSDNAKGGVARLAGVAIPKFEDVETTFAQLGERLERTSAFIQGVSPDAFAGAGARALAVKFPSRTLNFASGWDYLMSFVLPNVYFHSVTAYDILRHGGVKVGKRDFLGAIGQG
jgi:hypothetical protein